MTGEFPDGYEVPTLSFLKDEPLFFRIPRKQAAAAVLLGGGVFLPALKIIGIFGAIALVVVVNFIALLVMRWLYAKDPYWVQHQTTHRYPLVRYLGN